VELFERVWLAGTPLNGAPDSPPSRGWAGELPALLATGITDEVAARQLKVNVRTVRRQVAALMAYLGAGSRFQAGVEAARRGLL
jgi:DNA-binding NarL/FixJ family response regulator